MAKAIVGNHLEPLDAVAQFAFDQTQQGEGIGG